MAILILENLLRLSERGAAIEIRIPLVPDFNEKELDGIGKFLSRMRGITKVRVLPYHNFAGSKYDALGLENTLPQGLPTQNEITMYENTLKKYGLSVAK